MVEENEKGKILKRIEPQMKKNKIGKTHKN